MQQFASIWRVYLSNSFTYFVYTTIDSIICPQQLSRFLGALFLVLPFLKQVKSVEIILVSVTWLHPVLNDYVIMAFNVKCGRISMRVKRELINIPA